VFPDATASFTSSMQPATLQKIFRNGLRIEDYKGCIYTAGLDAQFQFVCFLATSDKIYNGYIDFKSDSYQISAFTLHTW